MQWRNIYQEEKWLIWLNTATNITQSNLSVEYLFLLYYSRLIFTALRADRAALVNILQERNWSVYTHCQLDRPCSLAFSVATAIYFNFTPTSAEKSPSAWEASDGLKRMKDDRFRHKEPCRASGEVKERRDSKYKRLKKVESYQK